MNTTVKDFCALLKFYQAFWQANSVIAVSSCLADNVTMTCTKMPEYDVKKTTGKQETLAFYEENVFNQVQANMPKSLLLSFSPVIRSPKEMFFTYTLIQTHDNEVRTMHLRDQLTLDTDSGLIVSIESVSTLLSTQVVLVVESVHQMRGVGQVCVGTVLNSDLANGQRIVIKSSRDGSLSTAVIMVDTQAPQHKQPVGTQAMISFASKTVNVEVFDTFYISNE